MIDTYILAHFVYFVNTILMKGEIFIAIPKWTGRLVGKMHNANITNIDLANKMNVSRQYVWQVLNGERTPAGAEQRFNQAFDEIVAERKN